MVGSGDSEKSWEVFAAQFGATDSLVIDNIAPKKIGKDSL